MEDEHESQNRMMCDAMDKWWRGDEQWVSSGGGGKGDSRSWRGNMGKWERWRDKEREWVGGNKKEAGNFPTYFLQCLSEKWCHHCLNQLFIHFIEGGEGGDWGAHWVRYLPPFSLQLFCFIFLSVKCSTPSLSLFKNPISLGCLYAALLLWMPSPHPHPCSLEWHR